MTARTLLALGVSLALGLLATACGGAETRADAPADGLTTLEATRLEGPFTDVQEFCQLLGAPSCAADQGAIELTHAQLATAGGQTVRLVPVTTRDAAGNQRIWMLLERGDSLWALAPLVEYAADTGVTPEVTAQAVQEADDAPDIVQLSWNVAYERDGVVHEQAVTEVCSVPADAAIACAHFDTGAARRQVGGPIPVEQPGALNIEVQGDTVEVFESTGRGDTVSKGRYRLVRPAR